MMKISVIIPTYKPQLYILECLDSLCKQTFSQEDFEVIVILNGCKEPYDGMLKDYFTSHPGINWQYVQTDTGGVSNARNIALRMMKGEYVAFIDDDDYVSPSYLEDLYNLAGPGTVSLCYPYAFNDGVPDIQLKYEITDAYDQYASNGTMDSNKVRRFFSGPCMKLIPAECVAGRSFDTRFKHGEDTLFMFLISDRISKASFTSKNAVYYRRFRENSAMTSKLPVGYVLGNCIHRIAAFSSIYFKDPFRYSSRRYTINVLGTFHILFSYLIKGKI